jgi:hypothetical protein
VPVVRHRQIIIRGVVVLAAVVVAACLIGLMAYRASYGTIAFWTEPPRISWCDRDYLQSPRLLLARAEVEELSDAVGGDRPIPPLVQVATVPPIVGDPVFAAVIPQATRDELGLPCAFAIYLRVGPDSYRPYLLSGGP